MQSTDVYHSVQEGDFNKGKKQRRRTYDEEIIVAEAKIEGVGKANLPNFSVFDVLKTSVDQKHFSHHSNWVQRDEDGIPAR